MIKNISDALNKTCLLGLTYFDSNGNVLKQSLLGGQVVSVDEKMGITLALLGQNDKTETLAQFIIPVDLSCWFTAPSGDFHTSMESVKISNPDYLITWDIHQSQNITTEGEQQWWEWVPRSSEPQVNNI